METQNRIEQIIGITAVLFLGIGCFVVLRPFISALLWAAILCFSTWPLYLWLERVFQGKRTLAALMMMFLMALILVVPFMVVGFSLADNVTRMISTIREFLNEGAPDPPSWIGQLPIVGEIVEKSWREMAHNSDKLMETLKDFIGRSRGWLLERSLDLGQGILQLSLSVLIAFFFYRDGNIVVSKMNDVIRHIVGDRTQHLLDVVGKTIKGVVYGILGTAIAQGTLATLGFWISGVPAPLLLGLMTFFLSLLPIGPPLIWIPATLWLFYNHHPYWGIFIGLWGIGVISSVDNFLKPYIISRGINLPFVLVFLGVLGGIITFGFLGVFLGPTLLAVGYSVVLEWSSEKAESRA